MEVFSKRMVEVGESETNKANLLGKGRFENE